MKSRINLHIAFVSAVCVLSLAATSTSAQHQHQISTFTSHNGAGSGVGGGGTSSAVEAGEPYQTPDDCRFYVAPNQDVSLACQLRTVNSDFDRTNFSVISAEHTVALSIRCNDTMLMRSSLLPGSLSHLARLGELSLEYCKLARLYPDALAGLGELRNLSVRTHNVFWPALSLEIEADAFVHTRQLERLDLSLNNIWSLPESLFCALSALRTLNMSANRLQDVNDLGFRERQRGGEADNANATVSAVPTTTSTTTTTAKPMSGEASKPCHLDVELLDVSLNHFVLLPANGFGSLKRLRQLTVRENEISMVDDKALRGLKHLQILDLSSNKIVALPSELFADPAQSIQEIYLNNNSISVLAPKLFANLEQLQALELSGNKITSQWIDRNTFAGLIRLVQLNLANNRITRLEPEFFADLYTLQILNLRMNQLETIQADTFAPMNNLHTLLLSRNNLKYLDAYSLNGLYVLSTAALDNNQLSGVHPEAFRNCSSLQELTLSGNLLKTVPLALKDMRLLRTVDLGENLITELGDQAFRGMTNLYGLRLISNQLQNISKQVFKELPNLQILNLAHNHIDRIESGAFEMMPGIQAIRVDGNRLQSMGGLFSHVPLMWLNISDNLLTEFDYSEISSGMLWLDLHSNEIAQLSDQFGVHSQLRLQTLDVSFNRLRHIGPTSVPNSIELLFMNDNWITAVEQHTFMQKRNLTRVDMYANQITTLDMKALRLMPVAEHRALPDFYIGGNPFVCDCNIDWLQKINMVSSRQYPRINDLDAVYCKLLNNRERNFIPLMEADPSHFLCEYKTHCFALCHCCEFDACDCEMTCPTNCTCFHDQLWSSNVIECSNAGYTDMPENIPMDTSELYIDGNNMVELAGQQFLGRKNLRVLHANNSNIQTVYNSTFQGLRRLLTLHLENNRIARLAGDEFDALESLRELYLQNNRLTYVDNRTFGGLRKLEVLRLENNKLMHFEVWQLVHNPYMTELGLADNMWSCECAYRTQWRAYVAALGAKAIDAARILCVSNNATRPMLEATAAAGSATDEVCLEGATRHSSATVAHTGGSVGSGGPHVVGAAGEHMQPMLSFVLAASCALVGFAGMLLGAWCYRRELNDWWRAGCTGGLCYKSATFHHPDDYDKDRLYDAYVSYSQQDEHFVNQVLALQLEQTVGYRLCLHYRDFSANAYVADTIVEAVDASRRTLLVLSRAFLYNEWSRFEVKSALHECVKRNRKLVFILYGDLPQRDIDADMRMYLRSSTCIEWEDKKFWPKLRAAMPQLRGLGRSAGGGGGGGAGANCLAKRSAVNIYATTTNPSIGGAYGPHPGTMGRGGMLPPMPPMPGHVVDYHTGRRVVPMAPGLMMQANMAQQNGGHPAAAAMDCNNYATINDCGRNCDKYESVLCKYSSTSERQRGKHSLKHPTAAAAAAATNANVRAMHAKTLERQAHHHEYAVPANLLHDDEQSFDSDDDEHLNGGTGAGGVGGMRMVNETLRSYGGAPPRTPARTPGRAVPASASSSSGSASGASLPASASTIGGGCGGAGVFSFGDGGSSQAVCNNCDNALCAGDERCEHYAQQTSSADASVTGSLNSTLAAGDAVAAASAVAAGRATMGGRHHQHQQQQQHGQQQQQQQQMWA